jgi:hypothetical protein
MTEIWSPLLPSEPRLFGIRPPELNPKQEILRPDRIISVSRSPKRGAFARFIAETKGLSIVSVPGGDEDNDLAPSQIVSGKIDHALQLLDTQIPPESRETIVLFAADVQSHTALLGHDGKTSSKARGKSEDIFEAKLVFEGMIDAARVSGDKRQLGYMIEASSESRTLIGRHTQSGEAVTNFFHVALQQDAVEYFATSHGGQEYLDALRKFLRSPQYISNGLKHPASPTEISGMLDLMTLEKLGAIRKINRVSRESSDYPRQLEETAFAAYVGFDVSILEQITPDAQQLINLWPWPKTIIAYATQAAA